MQTQTYDTSVMLAFKYLISAFFLACKSPKNLFLARLGFAIFYYWSSMMFFVLKLVNFQLNLLIDY